MYAKQTNQSHFLNKLTDEIKMFFVLMSQSSKLCLEKEKKSEQHLMK